MKLSKKLYEDDKMYGSAAVGSRGQIVIPSQARKDLNIKPGDQLIVMGKMGKALGLIKADQFYEMFNMMMDMIADQPERDAVKKHFESLLKTIK